MARVGQTDCRMWCIQGDLKPLHIKALQNNDQESVQNILDSWHFLRIWSLLKSEHWIACFALVLILNVPNAADFATPSCISSICENLRHNSAAVNEFYVTGEVKMCELRNHEAGPVPQHLTAKHFLETGALTKWRATCKRWLQCIAVLFRFGTCATGRFAGQCLGAECEARRLRFQGTAGG